MTDTASNLAPKQGKFRRLVTTAGAWLRALDYTGFDFTHDRIERLEREVEGLTEALMKSRAPNRDDA